MMKEITVVMPVYKVEKYVSEVRFRLNEKTTCCPQERTTFIQ